MSGHLVAIVCYPFISVILIAPPCHTLHVALHFPNRLQKKKESGSASQRLQSCETGAGGERIRNHRQRKFKVRMRDGHVAGTTWQVADVKRPLMSVAKMVAAGNRVHLGSKDPRIGRPKGDVISLRKAGNVFVIHLWVRKDATSREPGFHRQA